MTSRNDRFMIRIRNFNQLVLALCLLCAILFVVITTAYQLFWPRQRNVHNNVNVDKSDRSLSEEVFLGSSEFIRSSEYIIVPVMLSQKYAGGGLASASFMKDSSGNIVNYLFINSKDQSSKWLIKGNSQLILNRRSFRNMAENKSYNSSELYNSTGFLYEIAKSDTNNNKRLDRDDLITIAVSSNKGDSYKELVSDVKIIGTEQISNDSFILLYKKNEQNLIAKYKIDGELLTKEAPLTNNNDNLAK